MAESLFWTCGEVVLDESSKSSDFDTTQVTNCMHEPPPPPEHQCELAYAGVAPGIVDRAPERDIVALPNLHRDAVSLTRG